MTGLCRLHRESVASGSSGGGVAARDSHLRTGRGDGWGPAHRSAGGHGLSTTPSGGPETGDDARDRLSGAALLTRCLRVRRERASPAASRAPVCTLASSGAVEGEGSRRWKTEVPARP